MNLFLIILTLHLNYIQIIDSKKVRVIPDDELYPYTLEKGVSPYGDYFSTDQLIFEQVGDDKVSLGGFFECVQSLDASLSYQATLRTQYLHQSTWLEGPLQLFVPDICAEFINPTHMWYNITKLWTSCPPQKGDKLVMEDQIANVQFDLPPSVPLGNWKFHVIFRQGLFGALHKFGGVLNVELIQS